MANNGNKQTNKQKSMSCSLANISKKPSLLYKCRLAYLIAANNPHDFVIYVQRQKEASIKIYIAS